jgi:hypothetical protein
MQSHLSSPWNNAVSVLEMRYGQQQLSTGSCFLWSYDERCFLVTNWHNHSGRNPLTGKPISPTAAIPDRIVFRAFKPVSEPDADGIYEIASVQIEVPLTNDSTKMPRWREHPTFGKYVDVGAIEVTDAIAGYEVATVNQLESDALLDEYVSQDVFIVGYPFGLMVGAPAPIWKRGTIALDPTFNADNLPKMLVDTATREGMSGSVVLARHTVVHSRYNKRSGGTSITKVAYAELDVVIGIYSGRHYPDHEKAQLGIVWKRSAIEETVGVGRPPVFS